MLRSVRSWTLWVVVTLATVPASCLVWLIGGMGMCGEEDYNTPPGSVGDSLCSSLVHPIVPWAILAAMPTVLTAVVGFLDTRRQRHRNLFFLLAATYLLAGLIVFASLAA